MPAYARILLETGHFGVHPHYDISLKTMLSINNEYSLSSGKE
jgi:hypothetical protein